MNLTGKTIIVTGYGKIGKYVVSALVSKGANVVTTYLSGEEPKFDNPQAIAIQADLTKISDVQKLIAETKSHFGRIDGLVHMAAIYQKSPWTSLSEADWDKNMTIIAKSAFLTCKEVANELINNPGEDVVVDGETVSKIKGKIITISDWSVFRSPYKDYLPYNSAKSAVVGLTLSLAKELAPNITVNNIAPGPTIKPADLTEDDNQEVMSKTPLKRWGGGEEIAKAVLYLIESDFITGVVLPVDGGRSIN